MFGESHPYGISYPESEYDNLCRDYVEEHYRRCYTAENCIVVCSGQISDKVLERITSIAEQIPCAGEATQIVFPSFATRHTGRVQHDGAVQSSIRIGRMLFPRSHEDFVPMQVLTTLLGGYFGSRLMQNLRERNGFTYGVFSAMVNFQKAGYLAIATQVGVGVTDEALRQIAAEIERLREELVPDEELQLVKNIMAGEMMRILDGPFGIVDVTIENVQCGTDNHAVERTVEAIRRCTPEDVLRLIAE